jgi:K+ potassium transporter
MASSTEAVSTPAIADHPVRARLLLGALGVVFGDIGTSPIYAFRESLKATGGASEAAVFGVLSLVFWAIVLVVAIKYVIFVMRADRSDGDREPGRAVGGLRSHSASHPTWRYSASGKCIKLPRRRSARSMFLKLTGCWPPWFSRWCSGFAHQGRSPMPMESQ